MKTYIQRSALSFISNKLSRSIAFSRLRKCAKKLTSKVWCIVLILRTRVKHQLAFFILFFKKHLSRNFDVYRKTLAGLLTYWK